VIHPQAIVHPGASLGRDVHIGAFSIIGEHVEIGDGTWVGPHVVINGPTRIGRNNRIFQFASVGEIPQDLKFAGETSWLEIGDGNTIRECCTLSRGTTGGGAVTRVGNDNLFMAYAHVAHDCQIGDHTVFANGATLAGHVEVGDYAILGGLSAVHQFCRLGAHIMVGGGSIVLQDVPPYLMVQGNTAKTFGLNLRGLKRRGFSAEAIEALKDAYRTLYRSGLTVSAALERLQELALRQREVAEFVAFVRGAERGIVR
jgi:UDP-N-acetylglucosamine acyltransferase